MKLAVYGLTPHGLSFHVAPMIAAGSSLAAVYDERPKARDNFRARYGDAVIVCGSLDELLEIGDGIIIAASGEYQVLRRAVDAGKHVLLEPPFAATYAGMPSVQRSMQQAEEHDLVVMGCFPRRFDLTYKAVKGQLSSWMEQYGNPVHIELMFAHRSSGVDHSGNSLTPEHFPHAIDWLRSVISTMFGVEQGFTTTLYQDTNARYVAGGVFEEGPSFTCIGTNFPATNPEIVHPQQSETIRIVFERVEVTVSTLTGELNVRHLDTQHTYPSQLPYSFEAANAQEMLRTFVLAMCGDVSPDIELYELGSSQVTLDLPRYETVIFNGLPLYLE